MKSLIFTCYFLLSCSLLSVNCFPNVLSGLLQASSLPLNYLKDALPNVDIVPAILTGLHFGSCPTPDAPPTDFELQDFYGTWYEIERSALCEILEAGQKCTEISFSDLNNHEQLRINTTVISTILNTPLTYIGSAKVKEQPHIFYTNLFGSETQFWIVDTDLDSYSLIFSCNQYLLFSIRNAWILGRKPTIDESIRAKLVTKLGQLGVPESNLVKHDQSCSALIPIQS